MALKDLFRRLTVGDRLLLILLFALGFALFPLLGGGNPGERVVVEQDGKVVFTFPLAGEQVAAIRGPLGETRLAIEGGAARLLSSPCPHQVCLGMGAIRNRGELIACLPNRILVRIEGGEQGRDYDLLSR